MVGASKILTVSYGTFSCTLEGFDDPFSTMRAIAEYFRDLAAEDRYFGATPPTPDAEMLHRIAEREIQRRVEARVSDHGIVLRAREESVAAPAAPLAEAPRTPTVEPAPVTAASATSAAALAGASAVTVVARASERAAAAQVASEPASQDLAFEDLAEDIQARAETEVPAPAARGAAMPAEPETETAIDDMSDIAVKLSRIRAVIAAAQAAKAAPSTAEIASEADAGVEARPAATFEEEPMVDEDFDLDAIDDDFGFSLELDELPAARSAGQPAPAAAVAAAAVSAAPESDAEFDAVGDLTGEETAAEIEDETAAEHESRCADLEDEEYTALAVAAAGSSDDADAAPAPEEDDGGRDALDLAGSRVDTDESAEATFAAAAMEPGAGEDADAAEPARPEPSAPEATETIQPRPGFFDRARASVIKIRRGDAPLAGTSPEAMAGESAGDVLNAGPTPEPESEATAVHTLEVSAEVARDVGESLAQEARDEAEHAAIFAALNDGDAAEVAFDDAEGLQPEEAADDAVLKTGADEPAEGYDAILAAITAIRADTEGETEADDAIRRDVAALARDARREAHDGRTILEDHAGDGEASVERLMEEAKSKLEGDENRRRFSAIAHLKAAVAATVADRKLKSQALPSDKPTSPVEEIDRYREDLSRAVRPRRPVAEGAPATRRPALNDRPAPLVLVSEQRVDLPREAIKPAAVIRPRRVGAAALSLTDVEEDLDDEGPLSPEEASSFAEFADRLGATNLSELLEAAAAYTATVEGMAHFSRPHLLRKVAHVADEEEFSREDGLRSFGMLLRQGKIQKISRGQFTITESSRFMSEARRVAR